LLVFDFPGDPEFSAVVPGGGIEEGETVAETAIREVMEETGIEVEFVREVGVGEDPVGHYVQVKPTRRLPEMWEHVRDDGPVLCRWEPIRADTQVWGQRGDFIHALVRVRVVGYVTRGDELLVFDHKELPDVPTQVPAGRVDAHETLEDGLRREVEEESGVSVTAVSELADADEFERLYGSGVHRSYAFHALAEPGGPDEWEHSVSGTGMDSGLTFLCRWVRLDECPPLWGKPDPLVEKLSRSIRER
jgi:ADP-ribose pyrophosphatase YjhB (NUDIX family)